ncbi:3-oxoacyl-[acyl-carrier-protein] reductase FabG [Halotydeus destructor]|nr:3-oxoacyl-[acyl-carrier-protein] reductase FabG [Halotydeus destructor]
METFDKVMAVNLRAAYQLSSIASPYLIASQGNIVNVSSVLAGAPSRGNTAYCISKAAMTMMTQSLAFELGMKGVRVNEVRPSWTDTPTLEVAMGGKRAKEASFELFRDRYVPMRRTSVPEDIAKAIVHLASSGQDMVNGLVYSVDAGFSIRGIAFD